MHQEKLKEAMEAIDRAKLVPCWDSINHNLHIQLDIIFKAVEQIAAKHPEPEAPGSVDTPQRYFYLIENGLGIMRTSDYGRYVRYEEILDWHNAKLAEAVRGAQQSIEFLEERAETAEAERDEWAAEAGAYAVKLGKSMAESIRALQQAQPPQVGQAVDELTARRKVFQAYAECKRDDSILTPNEIADHLLSALTAPPASAAPLTDEQIGEVYTKAFNDAPGAARQAPKPPPLVIAFGRALLDAIAPPASAAPLPLQSTPRQRSSAGEYAKVASDATAPQSAAQAEDAAPAAPESEP